MANKIIAARRAVYRLLYEKRVENPGAYFSIPELMYVACGPELSAALFFGLEMGHLEKNGSHWRMTAFGMLFTESENYVEGED